MITLAYLNLEIFTSIAQLTDFMIKNKHVICRGVG